MMWSQAVVIVQFAQLWMISQTADQQGHCDKAGYLQD